MTWFLQRFLVTLVLVSCSNLTFGIYTVAPIATNSIVCVFGVCVRHGSLRHGTSVELEVRAGCVGDHLRIVLWYVS